MEFYKVLYKHEDGTLRSAIYKSPYSIIYGKITYAPKDTVLFVFSDLTVAKDFSGNNSDYVIYRVNATNPGKPALIISPFYLDEITKEDIVEFWKGTQNKIFSAAGLSFPIDFTYVCDSVELLEEIT